MPSGLTESEQFVNKLCEQSFLKLWTHPNPIGKKGKELCDCLVVFQDIILIISVKDITYKDTEDQSGWERWTKQAIDKSAKQLHGAQRWLEEQNEFTRSDGRVVRLPLRTKRRYLRLSVSLGSKGEVPLKWGQLDGRPFVHVYAERSLVPLFDLLDTVADFTEFLFSVEQLAFHASTIIFNGGDTKDLLAMYLLNGPSFGLPLLEAGSKPLVMIENDHWDGYVKDGHLEEFMSKRTSSYKWDRFIEVLSTDLLDGYFFDLITKETQNDEIVLARMAAENRYYRIELAQALFSLLKTGPNLKIGARLAVSPKCAYVFMAKSSLDRDERTKELALRCMVVASKGVRTEVVGIGVDPASSLDSGWSADMVYVNEEGLQSIDESILEGLNDTGYFANVDWKQFNFDLKQSDSNSKNNQINVN